MKSIFISSKLREWILLGSIVKKKMWTLPLRYVSRLSILALYDPCSYIIMIYLLWLILSSHLILWYIFMYSMCLLDDIYVYCYISIYNFNKNNKMCNLYKILNSMSCIKSNNIGYILFWTSKEKFLKFTSFKFVFKKIKKLSAYLLHLFLEQVLVYYMHLKFKIFNWTSCWHISTIKLLH